MTGQWEACLRRINKGEAELSPFMEGIHEYVSSVVNKVRVTPRQAFTPTAAAAPPTQTGTTEKAAKKPTKGALLTQLLEERFGFKKFLPGQKAACTALVAGKDVALVLPAGKGKTLCYQLAGLALEGTTLVCSARTEWLDEQVKSLQKRGLSAAGIRAGHSREALRAACVDYLNGRLQFLFFAPERLGVEGFAAMLAKRKVALMAIEEAERVLPGHGAFLSDYTLLSEQIATLRPAPILALSASATQQEEAEIARLLQMKIAKS